MYAPEDFEVSLPYDAHKNPTPPMQWLHKNWKGDGGQTTPQTAMMLDDQQIKEAMAGMLDPELRETAIGHAEVRQVFDLTKGIVAGCMVTDGRISRTARARVLRRKQPIYDGGISTLRRFKDDVKEVRNGFECGIKLGDYSEYEAGDIIQCYTLEKVARKLE